LALLLIRDFSSSSENDSLDNGDSYCDGDPHFGEVIGMPGIFIRGLSFLFSESSAQ
jgi:hypothetical protein